MPTDPIVEFDRISKTYPTGLWGWRKIHALRAVSLTIPSGSVFGLLGPNRAGKTTLIKILLSICQPTSGSVKRFGRPGEVRGTLAHVGYLHESQAFPRYLTATGLLEYYGAMTGVSAADLRLRIPRLLERVGLTDRTCEPISGFSKGMVQRLALAQALVNEPELLVLDEPTEGMDLVARQLLHEVIRHRQQQGRTAILVSHSLSDVEQLCDRVAVLRAGELAFTGTLSELAGDESAGHLEEALEPLYAGAAP